MESEEIETVQIMLLGDSCCGKTCLLVRFKDNTFLNSNFISTVGFDYRTKMVELEGIRVKLQIWDTAGQERFRSLTKNYYRDANALFLVFDVTNPTSFANIRGWLADIRELAQSAQVGLIGNKCDLTAQRKVKAEEAESLAKEYDIPYFECSAKSGYNVDHAFLAMARTLVNKKIKPAGTTDVVKLDESLLRKRVGCCRSS